MTRREADMLTYILDKTRSEPLYIQIYQHIRADIELGNLPGGSRLPSKRELAVNLGVSVITIENAYAQLIDEGYVRSELKKGYFVEKIPASERPARPEPTSPSPVSASESEEEETGLFPFSVWAKLMREELCYNQSGLMTRPPSEGVPALREAIAKHLLSFRNMRVSAEQIVIGAGTEHLYIKLHLLLGASCVMGVEDPGYPKIADIYQSLGHSCARIPMEEDGVKLQPLYDSGVDALHISPSHQFPTGSITSIGKRYALLGWASEGRYIVEDDYDSEFRLSGKPIPSLFSIDVTDRVVYMNTFSKSLTPTIRISYMVLPGPLLERYHEKLSCYSCAVSAFEQYTLARFISEGYFEKHIHRTRSFSKKRRDALLAVVREDPALKGAELSGASAGMHCLVSPGDETPAETQLARLRELGFQVVPIDEFYHVPTRGERPKFVVRY